MKKLFIFALMLAAVLLTVGSCTKGDDGLDDNPSTGQNPGGSEDDPDDPTEKPGDSEDDPDDPGQNPGDPAENPGNPDVNMDDLENKSIEELFPDANFRAYVLENFDTDKDGKISPEEALAVTNVQISQKSIVSLEGIQYFAELNFLYCSDNMLTSLDVSKNTKLKRLHCYKNKLTSLDVSKNTALNYFDCHSNQLTSLDVSKNTALTWLDCSDNQLTSLDVSKNMSLEYLRCNANQLTSLDLSKNTVLAELYCHSNQLTNLDVSKTNLGNSSYSYPLDCAPMSTLQTLTLKTGWSIDGINTNRSPIYIPDQTEIKYVD